MKLGLGTVQFGTDYGVSNVGGKVSREKIAEILALADSTEIDFLDTAPGYGDSEKVLGENGVTGRRFRIVTKTPGLRNAGGRDIEVAVRDSVLKSLAQLGCKKIYGILIHHADDLIGPYGTSILEALTTVKNCGVVEKIGVSVYDSGQIDEVLKRKWVPDIIQLPINVLDQRLVKNGYLKKLKNLGVEIHARSLFLQGLLLMDADRIPDYFRNESGHFVDYAKFLADKQLSRIEAALGFIKQQQEIDVAIVGVTDPEELTEIVAAWRSQKALTLDMSRFGLSDEAIINPSKWRFSRCLKR